MGLPICIAAFVGIAVGGCGRATQDSQAGKQRTHDRKDSEPEIVLRDVADEAGIRFQHTDGSSGRHYFIEQIGAGCALVDYDHDGLLDVFALSGASLPGYKGPAKPHAALYHNLGNRKFEDVSDKAGFTSTYYSHGVCAGDYDNDGRVDLFVTCTGKNHLYHNNGNGTFTDVAAAAGVAGDDGIHTSACFVDYDNDGRLDLYVCGYVTWSLKEDRWCGSRFLQKHYCGPEVYRTHQDRLYHNNGSGTFSDRSKEAGIVQPRSKSLGVVATDVNNDGWPDLYVTCDLEPNLLFMNDGHGHFSEQGVPAGVAFSGDGASEAGMGVAAVDYDNNGLMDLFVTNYSFEMYALYKNQGKGFFSYESARCGVGPPTLIPLGFGIRFIDLDNSGWQDILIANGHVLDDVHDSNQALEYAQTLQLLRNRNGQFTDVSATSGPAFKPKFVGRGLASGDFDNDGRVDALVNDNHGPLRLIHNESPRAGHWLRLQLVGANANRSAIGARVTIKGATGVQTQEVVSGSSFLSQSDLRLHFGLGGDSSAQEVTVRWPGSHGSAGRTQTFSSLAVDRTIVLIEGKTNPEGGTN
jgi:hypothetical protein